MTRNPKNSTFLNRNAVVDDYTNITSIGILCRFLEKRSKKGVSREIKVDKSNI
nr:MAG TPA: hypothetical protein [Microviridae sp.]